MSAGRLIYFTTKPMQILDETETQRLLPMRALVDALAKAMAEYAAGRITCPERLSVPLTAGGVMLSMPASADDIAIHKLVNVAPGNRSLRLPTIHGLVVACDVRTGRMLFQLDGPALTARRTAAVSMLAISRLLPKPPGCILVIGTGKQAASHVEAIGEMFPRACVRVRATRPEEATAFVARLGKVLPALSVDDGRGHADADVVITLTTSKTPVYSEVGKAGRLIVGVGAFTPDAAEIGAATIANSTIYVDDPVAARHEAGDLIQAGADWARVRTLASVLDADPDAAEAIVFKSVGCAAWDLAACRVISAALA